MQRLAHVRVLGAGLGARLGLVETLGRGQRSISGVSLGCYSCPWVRGKRYSGRRVGRTEGKKEVEGDGYVIV